MTAILDQHRDHEPGRLGRRKGDEQRVVAQSLRHLAFVVFLGLADRENLGGAGLACNRIRRAPRRPDCGAARPGGYGNHGVDDDFPVCAILELDWRQCLWSPFFHGSGHRFYEGPDEARPEVLAAHGQQCRRIGELKWGRGPIALADAEDDRLSWEPDLLLALLEDCLLPLRRWHDAAAFAADVDAGRRAESDPVHRLVDALNAERVREAVEVDIARLHDGIV